jgi:putative chitinase
MTEIVLDYPREIVKQTEFWSCGPGAAEIVLRGRGVNVSEQQLIRDIGTDQDGTDFVGLIEQRALNKHDPAGKWKSVYLPKDPPTQAQKEDFWRHVVQSIQGNRRGLVLNWVVPPWNRPKPVAPSTVAFSYPNAWVWHYVACMGFSDEGMRKCWIADSGFSPGGGWVSWEQTVSLITPKGYAFSAAPVAAPPAPKPPAPPVDQAVSIKRGDWETVWRTHIEWLAFTFGDERSVAELVAAAKTGDVRANRALARLEQVNPAALTTFLAKG